MDILLEKYKKDLSNFNCMNLVVDIFSNKILISAGFSFIVTGILKIFFTYVKTKKFDWRVMFHTGGMPSSHTAFVVSASTAIYFLEGVSNLFALSIILCLIVMADAIGLRTAVGKQATLINRIIDEFIKSKTIKTERLYELLGHTPLQTLAGFILGILVTHVVFLL